MTDLTKFNSVKKCLDQNGNLVSYEVNHQDWGVVFIPAKTDGSVGAGYMRRDLQAWLDAGNVPT